MKCRKLPTIKNILLVAVILSAIFCANITTVFAAEGVKINDEKFNTGDTITYIVNLQCDKVCAGINATVTYPAESLTIVEDSINVPNLGMTIANSENEGQIKFAAVDAEDGFNFTEQNLLISVSFKIKDDAKDATIQTNIDEIIDVNLANIGIENYLISEKIEKGTYEGEIVNPGDGAEYIENDTGNAIPVDDSAVTEEQDSKTTVIIITVAVAAAVIILTSVAVVYKRKKDSAV